MFALLQDKNKQKRKYVADSCLAELLSVETLGRARRHSHEPTTTQCAQ